MRELSLDRVPSSVRLPAAAAVSVLLFLFAVQLLGAATDAAAPTLRGLLARVVRADSAAVGVSWLAAYAVGNGSLVAALALSLFESGVVSATHLFLMIAGSRLGAAAIVVFIGALDFAQKDGNSLRSAVSMGLLTFLVTHSIYLPVTVGGYLALPALIGPVRDLSGNWSVGGFAFGPFEPIATGVTGLLGPLPALVLAILGLFGSLALFDRVLGRVDTAVFRDRFFSHFRRTWLAFATGVLITGATTSVAFSLGVIVPLYNRGYVERDELVPYVLGANLGTLADTILVALVLQTPVGIATVLVVLGLATLLTLVTLVAHDRYTRAIAAVDDRLVADRQTFLLFVVSLLVGPLLLVVVPLVV